MKVQKRKEEERNNIRTNQRRNFNMQRGKLYILALSWLNDFINLNFRAFSLSHFRTCVAFTLILVVISCCKNYNYKDSINFDSGWHKDSTVIFDVFIEDTSKVMDLILTFRHSDEYMYNNLWIFASVENIEFQTYQNDTIEFYMGYPDGRWFGKKKGKFRYLSAYYKNAVKMANPGNYKFQFRHGMRIDNLDEISGLEFKVINQ